MDTLKSLIAAEALQPGDPRVTDFARAIIAPFGETARAVIFYGSCLREAQLDGLMLDFYVIVSDYAAAYRAANKAGWMARANALIPPNVFPFEHDGLAAKYAVLSAADFDRECGPDAKSISVLARFAQPTRLVWSSDEDARQSVLAAVAQAAPTLIEWTLPVTSGGAGSPEDLWKGAFALTFGAELRAERTDRSARIVDSDPERYYQFGLRSLQLIAQKRGVGPNGEVPLVMAPEDMARWWRRMQRKGKLLSVVRLAKASATFAGGVDYIAWKINRHAGTDIVIKPWQRKHPLLAAISLLPRLLRSGAVR